MAEVTFLLGSNLGDRANNIKAALTLLDIALNGCRTAISDMIETKACGFDGPDFLNLTVRYRTSKKPSTLLNICKTIERNLGRTDAPEFDSRGERVYHDRIIDIDILLYGDLKVSSPDLTIPHPQIESRPFVRELLSATFCVNSQAGKENSK